MSLKLDSSQAIGLMGHVIACYPSRNDAVAMVDAMVDAGASIVEIQIPFSEPMADGPTFMLANQRAVEKGIRVDDCMELMRFLSARHPKVNFLFMTYANIAFKRGYQKFIADAKAAGCRGVIVPDLAFDSAPDLIEACKASGFEFVPVVSPNCSDERIAAICKHAGDLVYVAARSGVTGKATSIDSSVTDLLARVRKHTDAALACGFGIGSSEQVAALAKHAQFAVIGSKSLQVFEDGGISALQTFWNSLGAGKALQKL